MTKNNTILQPIFVIYIDGKQMPAWMYECVTKVEYTESESDGDLETLEIYFDDPEMQVANANKFKEKKTNISCKMGYINDSDYGVVFKGKVQIVESEYPESGRITLTITAYNKSYNMNESEKSHNWKGLTYSKIAKKIGDRYKMKTVIDSTESILKSKSAKVVQSSVTDLAFMKTMARKCGYKFRIISATNTLYFVKPKNFKINKTHTVDYKCGNEKLLNFKPKFNDYKKAVKIMSANMNIKKNTTVCTDGKSTKKKATTKTTKKKTNTKYKVRSGDTLNKIAKRFGVKASKIYNANKKYIKNPNALKVGIVLVIPK